MRQIRLNCFETNSSSTHCLVVTEENTFEKWVDGVLFYNEDETKFIDKEDFLKVVKGKFPDIEMKNLDELIHEGETKTDENNTYEASDVFYSVDTFPYDFWNNGRYEYLMHDRTTYTTPKGEKLAIHCWYGYDG